MSYLLHVVVAKDHHAYTVAIVDNCKVGGGDGAPVVECSEAFGDC